MARSFPHHEILFELNPWLDDDCALPPVTVQDPNSKWRMSSAWQKAIRRGDMDTALLMLAGLMQIDLSYVASRIRVIAVEDIGYADWQLVHVVEHVGRLPRVAFEARLRRALVNATMAMVRSKKSRAVCDLSVASVYVPYYNGKEEPGGKLLADCVHVRKLLGGRMRALDGFPYLGEGMANADLHEYLKGTALGKNDAWVTLTARLLNEKGGMYWMPAAWVSLADVSGALADAETADDHAPPFTMIGAYPSYSFDKHCHDGKRALAYFRKACPAIDATLAKWGIDDVDARNSMFNELIFITESAVLMNHVDADLERRCLAISNAKMFRPLTVVQVAALQDLLRENIDTLNKARAKVIKL